MERSVRRPVIDVGYTALRVRWGSRGLEIPIERSADGSLTSASVDRMRDELRRFFGWRRRFRPGVTCALPARGVSVRRFSLPPGSRAMARSIVSLQLERDIPMDLGELAWGYRLSPPLNGTTSAASEDFATVIAVRRDFTEPYERILESCGLRPIFVLRVLAARSLFTEGDSSYVLLDVDDASAELVLVENGEPRLFRVLGWGDRIDRAELARSVAGVLAVHRGSSAIGENGSANCVTANNGASVQRVVHVVGRGADIDGLPEAIEARLGAGSRCVVVRLRDDPGESTAIMGLGRDSEAIELESTRPRQLAGAPSPSTRPWPWVLLASALLVAWLAVRYAPSLVGLERLRQQVATLEAAVAADPSIDPRLEFYGFLEERRSRILEALARVTAVAPQGTHLSHIATDASGTLSLTGTIPAPDQAIAFRDQLVRTGSLTHIVLEDVAVAPSGNGWQFRIQARLSHPSVGPPEGALAKAVAGPGATPPAAVDEVKGAPAP
jgi:hypothetical protein